MTNLASGIYGIINERNGKTYVGSAIHILNRWRHHYKLLKARKHHSILFQRAWDKYGHDAFVWVVLENAPLDTLLQREQHWMDLFGSSNPQHGYNICQTAGNSSGRKLSPFQLERFATYWRGRTRSDEFKRNLSLFRSGRRSSEETKRRISESKTGKPSKRLGMRHTLATCELIRRRLTGRRLSAETREKIRRSLFIRWSHISREAKSAHSKLMNDAKYGRLPAKELL